MRLAALALRLHSSVSVKINNKIVEVIDIGDLGDLVDVSTGDSQETILTALA